LAITREIYNGEREKSSSISLKIGPQIVSIECVQYSLGTCLVADNASENIQRANKCSVLALVENCLVHSNVPFAAFFLAAIHG
jgi:hypothetical protein